MAVAGSKVASNIAVIYAVIRRAVRAIIGRMIIGRVIIGRRIRPVIRGRRIICVVIIAVAASDKNKRGQNQNELNQVGLFRQFHYILH